MIGGRNTEVFSRFLPSEDPVAMDVAKEKEYRRRLSKAVVEPTPGLLLLLDRAKDRGIPCILATNACRANVDAVLDALGLADAFCATVSADDCDRGKPHPEIYLRSAQKAGVQPEDCLAFEDSVTGVTSAHAAGCRVVGMTTSLGADVLGSAGASFFAEDFEDYRLRGVLGSLFE